jgi:hypothetical protein
LEEKTELQILFFFSIQVRAAGAPIETVKYMGCGVCDSLSKTVNLFDATRDSDLISK